MTPPVRFLSAILLASAPAAHANLDPAMWQSVAIPTSGTANNEWYFFPDAAGNSRVLVKGTGNGGSVNRRLLTGPAPTWTGGDAIATANLNKQGVLVRRWDDGIFLVALHGTNLRVLALNAAGTLQVNELVDNTVPVSPTSVSAEVDSGGNLHIAYVGRPGTASETLRYARRTTSGQWVKTSQDLSTTLTPVIQQTAIVPTSSSTATIYFTLRSSTVISLLSVSVLNLGGTLVIAQPNTHEQQVEGALAATRRAGLDRVYYFGKGSDGTLKFKRLVNGNVQVLQDAAGATVGNIVQADGLDGRQRLAWYDSFRKKINMLVPSGPADGPPYNSGQPVATTGAAAELRGLHYGPSGFPCILYRNSANQGMMAFPSEATGSDDLLEYALGGPDARVEAVAPDVVVPGIPFSVNRFKFRVPTIGSAISNGASGLMSVSRNLTYSVETSTDAEVWAEVGAGSPLTFIQSSATGTNPDQKRIFTGIYNQELGVDAAPRRFFRVKARRTVYTY